MNEDQKLEARIKELEEQLAGANYMETLAVKSAKQLEQRVVMANQHAEAAERKLADLRDWLQGEIEKERAHLISIGGPTGMRNSTASVTGLARNSARAEVLAQIEQPQGTPTEPATDYREIGREMAENRYANLVHAANRGVKCREALESLISLCNERGLTVGYGDHGQVTLSEESVLESLARQHHREVAPTQQLPGEDPPFDACRCPACVTVRAKSRSKS